MKENNSVKTLKGKYSCKKKKIKFKDQQCSLGQRMGDKISNAYSQIIH